MTTTIPAQMALFLGDVIDGLTVCSRTWSPEQSERLEELLADEPTPPDHVRFRALLESLGVPEAVGLSGDGAGVAPSQWCRCSGSDDAGEWVRYERWTSVGLVAHGFCCRYCRNLVQSG